MRYMNKINSLLLELATIEQFITFRSNNNSEMSRLIQKRKLATTPEEGEELAQEMEKIIEECKRRYSDLL